MQNILKWLTSHELTVAASFLQYNTQNRFLFFIFC